MNRVTDQTRNDVWQGLIDAGRLARYYQAMADRHRRFALWVRLVLVASATGGVAAFFGLLPEVGQIVAGAFIALAVVVDLVFDPQHKAAVLNAIANEVGRLDVKWQSLWGRVDNTPDEEARYLQATLLDELNRATERIGDLGIGENRRLNEICTLETYQVVGQKYGTVN